MFFRVLIASFSLLFSSVAFAVGKPFDQAAFDAELATGKPILLAIHADWCPTCRAQDPQLTELLKQPEYKNFSAYRVDYDSQKDTVRKFKVPMQSTLLVFRDGKEVGRSTGQTRREALVELMNKAVK